MATNNRQPPEPKPLGEIPNKIFYSISEASEYTGVEPHVLRYWETKFSKLSPKRVSGNQRKYTRNDLELLYEIVRLLYMEGYTLDGAEKKLRAGLQALRAERHTRGGAEAPAAEESVSPAPGLAALTEIKEDLRSILAILDEPGKRS